MDMDYRYLELKLMQWASRFIEFDSRGICIRLKCEKPTYVMVGSLEDIFKQAKIKLEDSHDR